MSAAARFILFQCMIIFPFVAGTVFKERVPQADLSTKRLIRANLIFIEPFIALWSIWGLDFYWEMIVLPVSGVFLVLVGMIAGWIMMAVIPLGKRSRAVFLISSSIANHGFTMGAFLCYLFLGEKGLGLAFLFLSYFLFYIYLVIFPYARFSSSLHQKRPDIVREYLFSLQNMPIFAIVLGLLFHAFHISRPQVSFPVDVFMLISISLYYFSMGMNFNFSDVFISLKESFSLSLIKFLIVPAVAAGVLAVVELDRQIETVIRIQSFMPAAIYSVVASVLFELDTKLSANLFVVNTLIFLFFVLPLLLVYRGYILGL